jgi:integrase
MMIKLPHVQFRKNHFRYRRKVPPALRAAIGKTEIVIPLGSTEAEVVRRYPKVHAEVEKRLSRKAPLQAHLPLTEMEAFQSATRDARKAKLNQLWDIETLDPEDDEFFDDQELVARWNAANAITDRYPKNPAGEPVGMSLKDAVALQVLSLGASAKQPEATLEDARRLYLKEKVQGTPDETKKTQRVDRVVGHIRKVMGKDPAMVNLTRSDARDVRDYMLHELDISASTVNRYLNDIRAIINHAIEELPLPDVKNPFNGLEVKKEVVAKNAKDNFSPEQLLVARGRVLSFARDDLKLIWRMLEGTGCRIAEISGLMVSDVHLDHHIPFIDLVFHEHRRLKTVGSIRRVPLMGDTLAAARAAVERAGESRFVFPAYFNRKGADAVSAALMKHIRMVIKDPKITNHSLRHTVTDWIRLSGATTAEEYLILGRSTGAVGEAYGGDEARLVVAERALRRALEGASKLSPADAA